MGIGDCFADGQSRTATTRLTVAAPDPADYDVDLDGLADLRVGDVIESGGCEIGRFGDGVGVVSVAGLPAGLSVETWTDDGDRCFGVTGRVRAAGIFTVRVGVLVRDGATAETVATEAEIVVSDAPYRYLKVSLDAASTGGGTVSGGGAMSVVADASVSAKAAKGSVFAGWLDADGEPADVGEGKDYRSPTLVIGDDVDFDFMELFGRFVPSDEDASVEIDGLDGEEFSFRADDFLDESFSVASVSLPVLTAKGLPAGVEIVPDEDGRYRLAYDGETAAKRPTPGRYAVTVTATNQSKVQASASFLLTVENVADARVAVPNDCGEFAPGEEIDPIDLSSAVDFARGESLAVSGLPRGLVYNKTANEKKGVAAFTVTGVPTAPGYYTLTFTARVVASATTNASGKVSYVYETATATSFLTVLPYPRLAVDVDDEALAAGNSVSGGGNYKPGTKVTLRANAAKGWVFAGWDGLWDVDWPAVLSPSVSLVTDSDDLDVSAVFMPVSEDWLVVSAAVETDAAFAAEFELGVDVADEYATLLLDLVDSGSLPTVKVSGLPSGVKFSSATLLLSGRPTKAGVYYATVDAKNAGGYVFTRILRLAVRAADGGLPEEPSSNAADIDFSPLDGLVTGVYCAPGEVALDVGPSPATGAAPAKASVSGVPAGLAASVAPDGAGNLAVSFTGTPSKVARYALTVKVTYEDRSSLTSKAFVIPEDGGSAYLSVSSLDESLGTVSGGGVYASGATVKLSAKPKSKCVFAGWYAGEDADTAEFFEPMAEADGIDFRTASVSFPFRPGDFDGAPSLVADFAPSAEDSSVAVLLDDGDGVWEIDPAAASEFGFSVDSLSLPSLAAKGLPKGVTVDLARGMFVYTPTDSVQPGIYAVTVTAQNQSKAKASAAFEVRVANRVTDMVGGLDPSMDAYPASVGVAFDPSAVVPVVGAGVKLSVKGLPSGLTFKDGVLSGVPTKAGDYTVTFTATSGSGASKATGVATVTIRVAAAPGGLAGVFNGFVYDDSVEGGGAVVGTVTATATAAGKVSASVTTASGTEKFSASSWAALDESGVATCRMAAKGGAVLALSVDSSADWASWQMAGTYETSGGAYRIAAQRNAFDAKTGEAVARDAAARLAGTYASDGLALSVQKTGVVRLSGKYAGKSVSGSSVLFYENGGFTAEFFIFMKNFGILNVVVVFDEESGEVRWTVF